MTMIEATLTVQSNAAELETWLYSVGDALSSTRLATFMTTSMLPYLRRRAKERFASEGDDVSGKWAPLTEATNEIRQRGGFPPEHPINQRTHGLYQWITAGAVPLLEISSTSTTMTWPGNVSGDMSDKFSTAQKGKSKGGRYGATPARPVVGLGLADATSAISLLSMWFFEQCSALVVTGNIP
jgi:hypothetical protein